MHNASNCARVMRVMDARARARVQCLRKRTRANETHSHYDGKLLSRDRDFAGRARWVTLTRIPGSVWRLFFYKTEKNR